MKNRRRDDRSLTRFKPDCLAAIGRKTPFCYREEMSFRLKSEPGLPEDALIMLPSAREHPAFEIGFWIGQRLPEIRQIEPPKRKIEWP